jgi:hypothetical protein
MVTRGGRVVHGRADQPQRILVVGERASGNTNCLTQLRRAVQTSGTFHSYILLTDAQTVDNSGIRKDEWTQILTEPVTLQTACWQSKPPGLARHPRQPPGSTPCACSWRVDDIWWSFSDGVVLAPLQKLWDAAPDLEFMHAWTLMSCRRLCEERNSMRQPSSSAKNTVTGILFHPQLPEAGERHRANRMDGGGRLAAQEAGRLRTRRHRATGAERTNETACHR